MKLKYLFITFWQLNNSRIVTGHFLTLADNTNHGYFLSGHVFTQFDVSGAASTLVMGINDAGNFAGSFTDIALLTQPTLTLAEARPSSRFPERFSAVRKGSMVRMKR
ncbi:MAG TPA: hypothetical protein VIL63_11590 [Terriglobales bacterium]